MSYIKISTMSGAIADFENSLDSLDRLSHHIGRSLLAEEDGPEDLDKRIQFVEGAKKFELDFKELWDYLPIYVFCSGSKINLCVANISQFIYGEQNSCIGNDGEEETPTEKIRDLNESIDYLLIATNNLTEFQKRLKGEHSPEPPVMTEKIKEGLPNFLELWDGMSGIIRESEAIVVAAINEIEAMVFGDEEDCEEDCEEEI